MIIKKLYANRLLMLADFLLKVPEKEFDLMCWSEGTPFSCDFVACAVGWACAIPEFRKDGLRLDGDGYVVLATGEVTWKAVNKFFGVGNYDSWYLFGHDEYPRGDKTKPKEVAERIRKFVKENLKPIKKIVRSQMTAAMK